MQFLRIKSNDIIKFNFTKCFLHIPKICVGSNLNWLLAIKSVKFSSFGYFGNQRPEALTRKQARIRHHFKNETMFNLRA